MTITHAYAADIEKSERTDDGDLLVFGKATGPDLDLDEQICDPEWLKGAMPRWAQWANIREQHSAIAAGVGLETSQDGDDWFVKSLVVDDNTARKVEKGVLKGYSIGIKNARVVKDKSAPGGRIIAGEIVEISLVDRPCNPTATMAIAKSADGSALAPVDAAGAVVMDLSKAVVLGDDGAPVEKTSKPKNSKAADAGDAEDASAAGFAELMNVFARLDAIEKSLKALRKAAKAPKDNGEDNKTDKGATIDSDSDLAKALAAAEERNQTLAADLAKAKAQPIAGGPAVMRTAPVAQASNTSPAKKNAAYYRQMADTIEDPRARMGYLELAKQADAAEKTARPDQE